MIDENCSSFTKTGPNKGYYKPAELENHSKERKEGKGVRAREKKDYQQSLVFIVWALEIVFELHLMNACFFFFLSNMFC